MKMQGTVTRVSDLFANLGDEWIARSSDLLAAAAILVIFLVIAIAFRRTVKAMLRRAEAEVSMIDGAGRWAFYPVLLLGLLLALGELDLNFAALGLEVSLIGVGIGFALKDILTNMASGVLIVLSRPFAPGDQISITEFEGTVETVGWRGTVLKTYDGRRVIIPNLDVFTNPVTNNTAHPVRRSSIFVGVGMEVDLRRAQAVAAHALEGVCDVAPEPPPEVLVKEVGDFAVKLEMRLWSPALESDLLRVNSDATRAVKEAFDTHGIAMPFPTQVTQLSNVV